MHIHGRQLIFMGRNYLQACGKQNHHHAEHSNGEMYLLVFRKTPSSVLTYIILDTHWNDCTPNAT